jgi:DNA-binding NtrC family response regulator
MRTILLVDDDPFQAFVRMSALEKRFRDVVRVADAAEALCLIEEPDFSSRLGLVISGHHRPGFGGPAFVAELHTRKPEVPVLVLGNGSENATDYGEPGVRFMAKSTANDELVEIAGQMMNPNGSLAPDHF